MAQAVEIKPALMAPFPYFGGKSKVAPLVWERLGDVDNFVEPFFGSGACLLARPADHFDSPTRRRVETVNDVDAYLANFWRAVKADPDAVADLLNWPVNEADLEARHKWLVTAARKRAHHKKMRDDPAYYDAQIAAWWCWGLCAWIGSGWCAGEWHGRNGESHGRGTHGGDCAKLPHLGPSVGVHKQLPHLGDAGVGVHKQRPHLGSAGVGVHKQRPHLGSAGVGECERRGDVLREWMRSLSDRFRNVRVCCGDWLRVVKSPSTTTRHGLTGVFLDPPYAHSAGRYESIYAHESADVAHRVREWCLEHGDDPQFRIALCGYEGEHKFPKSWACVPWKATGGYGNQHKNQNRGKENAHRERIWFSPHCLDAATARKALFA